jgi:Zn-dependent M28 family amino/carboxypeptidase
MPSSKYGVNIIVLIIVAMLALLIVPNLRALYEGIFFYLRDTFAYTPTPSKQVSRDGRYGSLYDLVQMRNTERRDYLLKSLGESKISVTQIPIANSQLPNLFIRFNATAPLVIFSAHYDKLFDDANYQGASDNTAAVSVMLAAAKEMAKSNSGDCVVAREACALRNAMTPIAFLFTGEEETGLRGSQAFVEYARANNMAIREIINFDNIGRGKLGIRPSAPIPGFIFTIPFVGDYAFDGRNLTASPSYPLANARVTKNVLRAQPNTTVYERFTALSDSNVFEQNGIDTVAISGDDMAFLERTWHTYEDEVELIDEVNLELAYELMMRYENW